jgi:hypothetical protein
MRALVVGPMRARGIRRVVDLVTIGYEEAALPTVPLTANLPFMNETYFPRKIVSATRTTSVLGEVVCFTG